MGLLAPFGLIVSTRLAESGFATQLDDLDSGLENDLWFLVIAVIVVLGVVYVYRGPKKI
jgi:hypothetical protein